MEEKSKNKRKKGDPATDGEQTEHKENWRNTYASAVEIQRRGHTRRRAVHRSQMMQMPSDIPRVPRVYYNNLRYARSL